MDREELKKGKIFDISEAFVMYEKHLKRYEGYDTGILKTGTGKNVFYDKLSITNMGSACLAAYNADISNEIIEVVRWGTR